MLLSYTLCVVPSSTYARVGTLPRGLSFRNHLGFSSSWFHKPVLGFLIATSCIVNFMPFSLRAIQVRCAKGQNLKAQFAMLHACQALTQQQILRCLTIVIRKTCCIIREGLNAVWHAFSGHIGADGVRWGQPACIYARKVSLTTQKEV